MDFTRLFEPKTMAVIGVSLTNDRHPANVVYYKNHLRYPVNVYPVNPQGGDIQGEKVYPHLREIPEKVDLAVIAVRAEQVPGIIEECVAAGVGGAAVISGGFAESGRKDLQDRLVDIAREADFPFVGPNCLGLYSPDYVDTFFIPNERVVRPNLGGVAMVSQSGGAWGHGGGSLLRLRPSGAASVGKRAAADARKTLAEYPIHRLCGESCGSHGERRGR